MTLHRWQLIVLVVLGALLGGVLVSAQSLGVSYAWLTYAGQVQFSAAQLQRLLLHIVTSFGMWVQMLIGCCLGGLTTYAWLQRASSPALAIRASLGGGLLLAGPLLCLRLYGAWRGAQILLSRPLESMSLVQIVQALLFFIILPLLELTLLWSLALLWWGLRYRQQVEGHHGHPLIYLVAIMVNRIRHGAARQSHS